MCSREYLCFGIVPKDIGRKSPRDEFGLPPTRWRRENEIPNIASSESFEMFGNFFVMPVDVVLAGERVRREINQLPA